MTARTLSRWIKWPALLAGMLLVLLFAVFLVAESLDGTGPFPLTRLTVAETWGIMAVFISMAGVLLAWWRPLIGGGLTLAGGTLFNVVETVGDGRLDVAWFAVGFMVVGALLMASGWIGKKGDAA